MSETPRQSPHSLSGERLQQLQKRGRQARAEAAAELFAWLARRLTGRRLPMRAKAACPV